MHNLVERLLANITMEYLGAQSPSLTTEAKVPCKRMIMNEQVNRCGTRKLLSPFEIGENLLGESNEKSLSRVVLLGIIRYNVFVEKCFGGRGEFVFVPNGIHCESGLVVWFRLFGCICYLLNNFRKGLEVEG